MRNEEESFWRMTLPHTMKRRKFYVHLIESFSSSSVLQSHPKFTQKSNDFICVVLCVNIRIHRRRRRNRGEKANVSVENVEIILCFGV